MRRREFLKLVAVAMTGPTVPVIAGKASVPLRRFLCRVRTCGRMWLNASDRAYRRLLMRWRRLREASRQQIRISGYHIG